MVAGAVPCRVLRLATAARPTALLKLPHAARSRHHSRPQAAGSFDFAAEDMDAS